MTAVDDLTPVLRAYLLQTKWVYVAIWGAIFCAAAWNARTRVRLAADERAHERAMRRLGSDYWEDPR